MSRFKIFRQRLENVFPWLRHLATRLDQSPRGHLAVFVMAWVLNVMMSIPLLILMLAGFYNFEALGMTKPRSWLRQLGFGLVLGLGVYVIRALLIYPFAFWISSLVGGWQWVRTPGDIVGGNLGAYMGQVAFAIVGAGFFEEFFYRGYLLNRTVAYLGEMRYRWTLANLAVATLFGLLHFSMGTTGVIFAFVWFIISSAIYKAIKRNLWPMMVAHAFGDIATWTLAYVGWLSALSNAVSTFYGIR